MRIGIAAVVCLLPAAVACTGNVASTDVPPDAETSSATAAVVTVERTTGAGDASHGEAVARFMRVKSRATIDGDEALRIVGAALDLPALGTCVSLSSAYQNGAPKDATSTVQLLDVGPVSMEANGVHTELGARQVPDVVDVVSGVVYARATGAEGLPEGAPYAVRVRGSSGQLPFTIAARAPAEPDVRIAGQDGREAPVLLSAQAPAELTWNAGASDANDVIYVDVAASTQTDVARLPTIRCAFPDVGRATLGASAFAAGDEGTLAVHRLHREAFEARGLDSGQIRFDFARVVTFTRR